MTLIAGSAHWQGICLNSDTRATLSDGRYEDNFQKISHIHGGIGMAAAGDCLSAIMFRETLRKNLDEVLHSGKKINDKKMVDFMSGIIVKSMKDVHNHPYINERPIYEIDTTGLIGINFPFLNLTLNSAEANNLLEILANANQPLNSIYSKIIEKISWCANSPFNNIMFEEFPLSILFTYKLKLFYDAAACIYDLKRVPFGKIIAIGSGSSFDYVNKVPRILSWMLFAPGSENIENATFHLSALLEYAEQEVPENKKFGFKTFGGSIIAAVIRNHKNGNSSTDIMLGDFGSKIKNKIISKVYEKDGKLWIETREGKNFELKTFPDKLILNKKLIQDYSLMLRADRTSIRLLG